MACYPKVNINDSKLFASFYYPDVCNHTCTICRVSILGDSIYNKNKNCEGKIVVGLCKHAFHEECIRKWKINNSKCPVCSQNFIEDKTDDNWE